VFIVHAIFSYLQYIHSNLLLFIPENSAKAVHMCILRSVFNCDNYCEIPSG